MSANIEDRARKGKAACSNRVITNPSSIFVKHRSSLISFIYPRCRPLCPLHKASQVLYGAAELSHVVLLMKEVVPAISMLLPLDDRCASKNPENIWRRANTTAVQSNNVGAGWTTPCATQCDWESGARFKSPAPPCPEKKRYRSLHPFMCIPRLEYLRLSGHQGPDPRSRPSSSWMKEYSLIGSQCPSRWFSSYTRAAFSVV